MKKYLIIILATMLFLAGCGTTTGPSSSDDQASGAQDDGSVPDAIEGLTQNQYDGLEISVNVLERKAILPGTAFQATVVIENKGELAISYVQGSGSYTTPDAVFLYSSTLQTVIPQDRLGIATMDFVTQELKPGESLLFKIDVLAIEPNPDFDQFTHELYMDEHIYIADLEFSDLQDRIPSLVAVAPGSYLLKAYFLYTVPEEGGGEFDFLGGATGYAVAETVINVT